MNDEPQHRGDQSQERRTLLAMRRMQAKIDALEHAHTEPIAIVGIGCRFPGGVTDPDSFWQLLAAGRDAITPIPPERWDVDAFFDPNADAPGKIATRWGGFLDQVDQFDAAFFGISPREAMHMDPQQRLLLEVAWEALEHAGQPTDALESSQTGVFIGMSNSDYFELQTEQAPIASVYVETGNRHSFAAGRLSYLHNFQGPSIAIDTVCSSSLVAVHLACQSLRTQECRMALAGGINLILAPQSTIMTSKWGVMASDGRCKTFDARADGVVRSEGCGIVVLKRLADALKDGDPILALIRGSAVNQDGRSAGLTAPNGQAQQALLRQALKQARIAPAEISYVETHGTGTPLGDPIEVEALATVYGQPSANVQPCVLGALKTNLGHMEAAAGVAGLIKAVLAMRHESIPANLHFQAPNAHFALQQTRLTIPTAAIPWAANGKPRYAGVSSFGLSGTNAHVIIEEPPAPPQLAETAESRALYLVPLSARSAGALRSLAERYREYLASPCAPPLADLAFSAATRRSHHPHRLAISGSCPAALRAQLDAFLNGSSLPGLASGVVTPSAPRLAFVFPGQGAQWPGMARQLYREMPPFRAAFEQCAAACRPFLSFSLTDELLAPTQSSAIDVIQPLLFAISVSLSALWQHWGVRPAAVVGHSMGEVAAAYVAGALSLEDAARVICLRSQLLRTVSGQGAMALVELSVAEAEHAIAEVADRVSVAVSNSPRATVLAGEVAALEAVLARLEAQQVFCRRINVDVASHSPQMDPLAPALLKALAPIQPHAGRVPLYSTVRERVLDGHELDAAYWMHNLRQPVQFSTAVAQLVRDGVTLFVELSPHPLLLPSIAAGLRERGESGTTLPSLRREEDEIATMLGTLGALYTAGVPLDWQALFPSGGRTVPLPSYPWQRERYWLSQAAAPAAAAGTQRTSGHPLLGTHMSAAAQPGTHLWETTLSLATHPYLAEHQVQGLAVLPGAAYLELALAGARALWGTGAHELVDVRFIQMLSLAPEEALAVQLAMVSDLSGDAQFDVYSRPATQPDAAWTRHASGRLRRMLAPDVAGEQHLDAIQARCNEHLTGPAHYQRLAAQGLHYGPNFQGIAAVQRCPGEALGRLEQTPAVSIEGNAYVVHPALLDAAFHVLNAAAPQDDDSTYLPIKVAQARFYARPSGATWSYARLEPSDAPGERHGDVLLLDAAGRVLIEIRGMSLQRLDAPRRDPSADWLYNLAWLPQPHTDAVHLKDQHQWLIVADHLHDAQPLADAIGACGGICTLALSEAAAAAERRFCGVEAEPEAFRPVLQSLTGAGGRPCRNIVVLAEGLPADDASPLSSTTEQWARVVALAQALAQAGWRDAPRLWLVTRGTQAVTPDDRVSALSSAPLWGLGRTMSYEHPEFRCTLLDLPATALIDEPALLAIELLAQPPDTQIALRAEGRFVARLRQYDPSTPDQQRSTLAAGDRPFRLESDRPGTLAALTLRAISRPTPGPGEVVIEVAAAGLNFLDVLTALGTYPGQDVGPAVLGQECAGTIVALGPGVTEFALGDAVVACVPGSMGTHVVAPASWVAHKPAALSFEAAAGLPITFATAYYGLHDLTRLQPGERVLIHSAAGGVGLAAIQIAHHLGAQVFATAGTPEKRTWLAALGIAHVYDSRSLAFADQVLADTAGQGVDVVLNSLTGAAIPASLSTLGHYGRFVEIGKKDIYQNAALALAPFRKSLSYYAVDLSGMRHIRPDRFQALLRTVIGHIDQGIFQPPPIEVFPIEQASDAFHRMAQGTHIGKFIVSLRECSSARIAPAAVERAEIDANATYLITGGLGGIGLTVAQWLIERGAHTLVLLGRSAPSPEARAIINELRASGATVQIAQADIANQEMLAATLAEIGRDLPPLRGIFHAAGVLDDGILLEQTPERFARVHQSKIAGAWHLHTLTCHLALDHFVLFSSVAALLGSPGQANYAAANAFLDALANTRQAQGLPALSINWGAWAEVGLAARQANRGERLAYRGMGSMPPAQAIAALERLMAQGPAHVGVFPFDLRQWRQYYPQVAALPLFKDLQDQQQRSQMRASHAQILETLQTAEASERRGLLEGHLRDQIRHVLRIDPSHIHAQTPLGSIGFDSLLALELRNRLETNLGVSLPGTLIWAYPTIDALIPFLAEKLELSLEEHQAAPNTILLSDDAALALLLEQDLLFEIEQLSDEEVRQSLTSG